MTPHNINQKVTRLDREIRKFAAKIADHGIGTTPQEKRAFSLAARCLNERIRDLRRVQEVSRGRP